MRERKGFQKKIKIKEVKGKEQEDGKKERREDLNYCRIQNDLKN